VNVLKLELQTPEQLIAVENRDSRASHYLSYRDLYCLCCAAVGCAAAFRGIRRYFWTAPLGAHGPGGARGRRALGACAWSTGPGASPCGGVPGAASARASAGAPARAGRTATSRPTADARPRTTARGGGGPGGAAAGGAAKMHVSLCFRPSRKKKFSVWNSGGLATCGSCGRAAPVAGQTPSSPPRFGGNFGKSDGDFLGARKRPLFSASIR